jgi:hypothetical protein
MPRTERQRLIALAAEICNHLVDLRLDTMILFPEGPLPYEMRKLEGEVLALRGKVLQTVHRSARRLHCTGV